MIGETSITLSHESVQEALTQYLNAHLKDVRWVDVTAWEVSHPIGPNGYTDTSLPPLVTVKCRQRPEPDPVDDFFGER